MSPTWQSDMWDCDLDLHVGMRVSKTKRSVDLAKESTGGSRLKGYIPSLEGKHRKLKGIHPFARSSQTSPFLSGRLLMNGVGNQTIQGTLAWPCRAAKRYRVSCRYCCSWADIIKVPFGVGRQPGTPTLRSENPYRGPPSSRDAKCSGAIYRQWMLLSLGCTCAPSWHPGTAPRSSSLLCRPTAFIHLDNLALPSPDPHWVAP